MKLTIASPLQNERFVQGEPVEFKAVLSGGSSRTSLTWRSNLDGVIGHGTDFTVNTLSIGAHTIKITGKSVRGSTQVRIFGDLDQFYQDQPAPTELARIDGDLSMSFVDGTGTAETWAAYPAAFNQSSTDPSKLVSYARLDVLRHQTFSEPLPFTTETIYDDFKTFVKTIDLRLSCDLNSGGGGQISVNRNMSVWDARASGTPGNADACKTPFPNPELNPYVDSLALVVHEQRHNEPGDPGHIMVGGVAMDATLENGSGYAWATMYAMWVYKYGVYDPSPIKNEAKSLATSLLKERFPTRPTHSNPLVQAIINELLGP